MPKKRKNTDPERSLRNKRIAIAALVLTGGAASYILTATGLNALNQRAVNTLTPSNPIVQVSWPAGSNGATWLPGQETDRIQKQVNDATAGTAALTLYPLEQVGRTLAESGWLDEAPTVRWTADGKITAEGTWRAPAAAVRVAARDHLIDHEGHRLPLDYPRDQSNQVVLHHPIGLTPPVAGVWEGEDIRAALDLIELLKAESLLEQVAGIDLGEGRASGRLAILTERGARVIWGGGPEHVRPGEQPTAVKLQRLKALLARTGRIDADVDLIDLRGPQILLERQGD